MSDVTAVRRLSMTQLTGAGARFFIWAYFATIAVLALWTIDDVRSPWPTITGLLLFAGTCAALSLDRGDRLSVPVTLLVCVTGVVNAVLISWQIDHGVFSQWYFGASTVALFFVSLRGRRLLAWVGFIALSAVIAAWGATTDVGLIDAAGIIGRQVPVLVAGTLFATSLRRTGDAIERLTIETSSRATAEAVAQATALERADRLAVLDQVATPLLTRLTDGSVITADDRLEFALAESELRDGLRARSLSVPAVIDTVRDARRRGVGVVLLDDSTPGTLESQDLERVIEATAAAIRGALDGRVTARLLPPGRDSLATVVVDGSHYAAYEIPRATHEAPRQ